MQTSTYHRSGVPYNKVGFHHWKSPDDLGYTAAVDRIERYCLLWSKEILDFRLKDDPCALTFVRPNGEWVRPDRHFESDGGSVPFILQNLPILDLRPMRYLGYHFHDSAYKHGGLWFSHDQGKTWRFEAMTRIEADLLLAEMIRYDPFPGHRVSEKAVYLGVRLGGWADWKSGDPRKRRKKC